MRRMYTQKQLAQAVASFIQNNPSNIVAALDGQDVEVKSIKATTTIDGIEVLVDKNNHFRFVEGNVSTSTISGVTFSYAKWSLSGSHLSIVVAGTLANGSSLNGDLWATITLPSWIVSKIYPVWGTVYIEKKLAQKIYNENKER